MTRTTLPAGRALLALAVVAMTVPPSAGAQTDRDRYLDQARRILAEVPLIDGHNDLPWELRTRYQLDFGRFDLAIRQTSGHTDVPRLREGLVGAQFWSTYTPSAFKAGGAARAGAEQNDVVHRMVARYPDTFELARTADDIMRIHRSGKIASLIGLEGGHMIENSLAVLRAFYRDGVRYMTLCHSDNTDWADSATDSLAHGGLTRFGEEVVHEMNRLGMLVDLSHVSDSTMWDALRVAEAPVILSHTSSRRFTPHPRNIPDDLAQAVAENGGVIMVNFVTPFIWMPTYEYYETRDSVMAQIRASVRDSMRASVQYNAWVAAHPYPAPDLGVVADHIEHLRDVAGVDHVGIGSDFDGIDVPPKGLEDVSKFPHLVAELLRRGWSENDAKKVVGLNVLRAMREAEASAARIQRERPPSTAQIEILDRWSTRPPWRGPVR